MFFSRMPRACTKAVESLVMYPTSISFGGADTAWCSAPGSRARASTRPDPADSAWFDEHPHISFASVESDFAAQRVEGATTSRPLTMVEALAPSAEARVITTHGDLRIIHTNEAWTRLCGYTDRECRGQTLSILRGRRTDARVAKEVAACARSGAEVEALLINYTKWGREFRNHLTVYPVASKDDVVTHFLGVLEDVGGLNDDGGAQAILRKSQARIRAPTPVQSA